MLAVITCMSLVASALAADSGNGLDAGEFRDTAHTTTKGEVLLHPLLMPSQAGLAACRA